MKTEDLIVQLASTAGPVRPLARPPVRLAQWLGLAIAIAALAIVAIGPRRDLWLVMGQPAFAALVALTLFMAVAAAAASLVLSIPGAERSALQRMVPVIAGATWGVVLVGLLVAGGNPMHPRARLAGSPGLRDRDCRHRLCDGLDAFCNAAARGAATARMERRAGGARPPGRRRSGNTAHLSD